EPEEGEVLCGEEGRGRLASLEHILAEAELLLRRARDLAGRRVLVTAGPTREWLDAVRFLSNASSGRMGYALAEAARDRGAAVVLVSGPTSLPLPEGVECVRVETAAEMLQAVLARFPEVEVVIKAAAVADYRPATPAGGKMKKGAEPLELKLEPTPDILRTLGERKSGQILVGFSAEVGDPVPEAWRKLKAKGLDLVVANDISRPGIGFEAEENAVTILGADGTREEVPPAPKRVVADRILNHVVRLLNR
ncbi:MAG: bifunctional phosphopantothenoylcysteine decarboxylase/phosphopantothenate--cysteine ligase CoaBC, partial [Bacillota bacterium]|nr:bifunctional phosphopantothenoylcysteine decarboxylase/phosphopantothenate--cysteine ligase CoaBC [Bacillota bacterium]